MNSDSVSAPLYFSVFNPFPVCLDCCRGFAVSASDASVSRWLANATQSILTLALDNVCATCSFPHWAPGVLSVNWGVGCSRVDLRT